MTSQGKSRGRERRRGKGSSAQVQMPAAGQVCCNVGIEIMPYDDLTFARLTTSCAGNKTNGLSACCLQRNLNTKIEASSFCKPAYFFLFGVFCTKR